MKKKQKRQAIKVKKVDLINTKLKKLEPIFFEIFEFFKKKIRVIVSLTFLSFVVGVLAYYRSEISGQLNELFHLQTQKMIESSKNEIVDSLEYYKYKVNIVEKELKFNRDIQTGVMLSELGRYAPLIDSIFSLALNEIDLDRKIELYTQVINLTGYCAEAFNNRAVAYRAKNLFDNAIIDYNIAVSLKPNNTDIISNRGMAYTIEGNYDKAQEDFELCLSIDTTLGSIYHDMGILLVTQKKYRASIPFLLKGIELLPENLDWNGSLINAYIKTDNLQKALELSEKLIELAPDYFDGYRELGNVLGRMKIYGPAIKAYSNAIKLYNGKEKQLLASMYNDRAFTYISQYDSLRKIPNYKAKILSDLDSAILLDPSSEKFLNKGAFYCLEGDLELAFYSYCEAYKLSPENNIMHEILELFRKLYGDEKLSIECDKILIKDPNNSPAYYWKSLLLMEKGEFNKALGYINKSINLSPDEICYKLKISCLTEMSLYEAAIEVVDSLIEYKNLTPSTLASMYLHKGKLFLELYGNKQLNRVYQYYNAAIELNPENSDFYYFRAILYANTGEIHNAIKDLTKLLSLMPESKKAYKLRAECYDIIGEYAKADEDNIRAEKCQENFVKININTSSHDMTYLNGNFVH